MKAMEGMEDPGNGPVLITGNFAAPPWPISGLSQFHGYWVIFSGLVF